MIEIARTQDEEVGDGTTSVIILAGEMLAVAAPFLEQQVHPTVVIRAFRLALEDLLEVLRDKVRWLSSLCMSQRSEHEAVKRENRKQKSSHPAHPPLLPTTVVFTSATNATETVMLEWG